MHTHTKYGTKTGFGTNAGSREAPKPPATRRWMCKCKVYSHEAKQDCFLIHPPYMRNCPTCWTRRPDNT